MKTKNTEGSIIVAMITNNIIFERISDGLFTIHNAFNTKVAEMPSAEFQNEYRDGIVFEMMGITKNDELCDKMYTLYFEYCQKKQDAKSLAQEIYIEWLCIIKNHFVESIKIPA